MPIEEADFKSIDELFSRDPMHLTLQDAGVIVAELIRQRKQHELAEQQGRVTRKARVKETHEMSADELFDNA
jgi:hypothetical protein